MTHDLWEELNSAVHEFLSGVTLAHLVEKQRTKPVSVVRHAGNPVGEPHPVSI